MTCRGFVSPEEGIPIAGDGGSAGIDGETENGFIWPLGVGDPGSGG